jgi:hypothetical protein
VRLFRPRTEILNAILKTLGGEPVTALEAIK